MRYYLDTEFDGHNGALISLALVREDNRSLYILIIDPVIKDPWVRENVWPLRHDHKAGASIHIQNEHEVGTHLRFFLEGDEHPIIISDSAVDVARFSLAITTNEEGGWQSLEFPELTFLVKNVDCYPTDFPGAVQHNSWWDAMVLKYHLEPR